MKYSLFSVAAFLPLCLICLQACNSDSSNRFEAQKNSFSFSSTSSVLTAYGASKIEDDSTVSFRCPTESEMSSESDLTIFYARANSQLPVFTLDTIPGIRSDTTSGFGISLSQFPIGMLDIYQKCNSTTQEKLLTRCPSGFEIVDECSPASANAKECVLIYEGTHYLTVTAKMQETEVCYTEEINRQYYSILSTPLLSYACDFFEPSVIPAVYQGSSPINECCGIESTGTLNFCLKPCGCRELSVQIVPKSWVRDIDEAGNSIYEQDSPDLNNVLRIGIFSNVEGNTDAFQKLLESLSAHNIDAAVSLGNLTSSGKTSDFKIMRQMIDNAFSAYDGMLENTSCKYSETEKKICCENKDDRIFPNTCNVMLYKVAFLAGLGDRDLDDLNLTDYNSLFGPSYFSSFIGKVQLVMLDTSDATLEGSQKSWLKSLLSMPSSETCRIDQPKTGNMKLLGDCDNAVTSDSTSARCTDCIGEEAYCIKPSFDDSNPYYGPLNCLCVPATSKICRNNLVCENMDGSESRCICTADSDCGEGGTCVEGICKPPLRIVFSYTPLFDTFGSRGNSFTSRDEAASLLSLLARSGVSAIFSGRVREYAHDNMANIDMYITGGGGADMSAFSKTGKHWLLVTIPDAYNNPDPKNMTVEVVEF